MIELTEDDLAQIEGWYNAASGESMTRTDTAERITQLKALIDKLGIEMSHFDEYEFKRLKA